MTPSTVSGINRLPEMEKREIYARMIPPELIEYFDIPGDFLDGEGNNLLNFTFSPGSPSVEMVLKHQYDFPDPILYGHLTDTLNGNLLVLLYILNDPESERFNVDQLADGQSTVFGTRKRNLEAENAAMKAGLAPGQVRRGLRMLSNAIISFEGFISSLQQEIYFVDPLYYHNAVIFEKYGFNYQKGLRLMERIEQGFSPEGDLLQQLDPSNPFRQPGAASSIRLRSWALHDNILGEPFADVTMYKYVGKIANVRTCKTCSW